MRRMLSFLAPLSLAVVVVTAAGPHLVLPLGLRRPAQVATADGARREQARSDRASTSATGRRMRFTATGPTPTILPPVCDTDGHCVYPGTQVLQLSGDWTGRWIQASGAVTLTTGGRFTGASLNLFVGTVKGCGTGTAVVRLSEVGTLAPAKGAGRWEVVPRFGTGALSSLTGSGTGRGGIESGVRTSTQTGRVACGRR